MTARMKIWFLPALFFALFLFWYTPTGGPLSDVEIDNFIVKMEENGSSREAIAMIRQFGEEDTGKHFIMINNIDYNETPGNVVGAAPGENAQQLMDRYTGHMIPAMLSRGSHPVMMGPAAYRSMDVIGVEGVEIWDMGGLVRYRSRRDFLEIVTDPAFSGKHHFKAAALEKTIAFPVEPDFNLGDPRLLIGLLLLALTALADARRSSQGG
ncbi:MAG TPA: hypothetical protein DEX20_05400 [Halieaceae bacterium]|nr:hypothetical protein [Halieaceae bacterium]